MNSSHHQRSILTRLGPKDIAPIALLISLERLLYIDDNDTKSIAHLVGIAEATCRDVCNYVDSAFSLHIDGEYRTLVPAYSFSKSLNMAFIHSGHLMKTSVALNYGRLSDLDL